MDEPFVRAGFVVPLGLATGQFRLKPLGPQHNDPDYEAWSSSRIRASSSDSRSSRAGAGSLM